MENKRSEKKFDGELPDRIRERVEWLRSLGHKRSQIKHLGLDRPIDDLTFQVLVNELTRRQAQCFTDL